MNIMHSYLMKVWKYIQLPPWSVGCPVFRLPWMPLKWIFKNWRNWKNNVLGPKGVNNSIRNYFVHTFLKHKNTTYKPITFLHWNPKYFSSRGFQTFVINVYYTSPFTFLPVCCLSTLIFSTDHASGINNCF